MILVWWGKEKWIVELHPQFFVSMDNSTLELKINSYHICYFVLNKDYSLVIVENQSPTFVHA